MSMEVGGRSGFAVLLGMLLYAPMASAQLPGGVAIEEPGFRPVASYDMDVRLDPETHTVSGTQQLTFRNTTGRLVQELRFQLLYRCREHA